MDKMTPHDENITFEHVERFGAVDAAESRRSKIQLAIFMAAAFGAAAWFGHAAGVTDMIFKGSASPYTKPSVHP